MVAVIPAWREFVSRKGPTPLEAFSQAPEKIGRVLQRIGGGAYAFAVEPRGGPPGRDLVVGRLLWAPSDEYALLIADKIPVKSTVRVWAPPPPEVAGTNDLTLGSFRAAAKAQSPRLMESAVYSKDGHFAFLELDGPWQTYYFAGRKRDPKEQAIGISWNFASDWWRESGPPFA